VGRSPPIGQDFRELGGEAEDARRGAAAAGLGLAAAWRLLGLPARMLRSERGNPGCIGCGAPDPLLAFDPIAIGKLRARGPRNGARGG